MAEPGADTLRYALAGANREPAQIGGKPVFPPIDNPPLLSKPSAAARKNRGKWQGPTKWEGGRLRSDSTLRERGEIGLDLPSPTANKGSSVITLPLIAAWPTADQGRRNAQLQGLELATPAALFPNSKRQSGATPAFGSRDPIRPACRP